MELEPSKNFSNFAIFSNYIIPIWNWSLCTFFCCTFYIKITLFLYGIGAFSNSASSYVTFNYIIPIWNWSLVKPSIAFIFIIDYIIPIWNWSLYLLSLIFVSFFITLFLYGIGASLNQLLGLQ